MLERIDTECKARGPRIILIGIGKNDSATDKTGKEHWVEPENYVKNLNKIYNISKKYTKRVVFVGLGKLDESKTLPVPFGEKPYYRNNDVIKYNSLLENFCCKNELLFIPMFDLLNKKDLEDGLHPNAQGHEKMHQRIKKYLIINKIIEN